MSSENRGQHHPDRRPVIVGLGSVGPHGAGREALAAGLADGAPHLTPLGEPGGAPESELGRRLAGRFPLRPEVAWAGQVPRAQLKGWLSGGEARRMSRPSRFAVAAGLMALEDAGLSLEGDPGAAGVAADPPDELRGTAVILATAFGPSSVTETLLGQILLQGPENASPAEFAESVANAPAAQVARKVGAQGPNLTLTQLGAGPLLAVQRAARDLALGRTRRALAGGVDEVTPLLLALLDRFRALATGCEASPISSQPIARPFDRDRSGFIAGEGATLLVLETAAGARERGRAPLAEVLASGAGFDPSAPRHGWGSGHRALTTRLRDGLERSGVPVGSIDLVVSGASGSRRGDLLEGRVLRNLWGDAALPLPPVLAPKATTGELAGGHLGAAVLAAAGAPFGPTPGFAAADPELGLVPHGGAPATGSLETEPPRRVLVTTAAAGGAFAWLVLGRPEDGSHGEDGR